MEALVAFVESNPPIVLLVVVLGIGLAYVAFRRGEKIAEHRTNVMNMIDSIAEAQAAHAKVQEEQHDEIEREIRQLHSRISDLRDETNEKFEKLHRDIIELKVETAKVKPCEN